MQGLFDIYPLGVYHKKMKKDLKKDLTIRLNRIEGQIRGLRQMVEKGEYCIDIINQSQAVKSALGGFEGLMLKNHLDTHVADQIKQGKQNKVTEEILKIYQVQNRKK